MKTPKLAVDFKLRRGGYTVYRVTWHPREMPVKLVTKAQAVRYGGTVISRKPKHY